MKYAFLAAAASLAGLLLAPAAQAQITCDDVLRVAEMSESSFSDILGEEIETDIYETTHTLPGARECRVSFEWDDSYRCIWEFRDEAAASRFGTEQMTMLKACLTEDWVEEALEPDTSLTEWRLIGGSEFTLSFDDEDFVMTSRVDASLGRTPTIYEVEFSFAYIWF